MHRTMSGVRSLSIWQIQSACSRPLGLQVGWHAGGRRRTAEVALALRITTGRWAAKSLSHNSRRKIPIQMLRLLSHAVQHAFGRQKEWTAFPMRRAPSAWYALAYSAGCREAGFFVTSRMHCRTWASMTVVCCRPR
jgi:hypothetical protein